MGARFRLIVGCGILLLISVLATAGGASGFFLVARDLSRQASAYQATEGPAQELWQALDRHLLAQVEWLFDPASLPRIAPLQQALERTFGEHSNPAAGRDAASLSALREAMDDYLLRSDQLQHARLDQLTGFFAGNVLPAYEKLRETLSQQEGSARRQWLEAFLEAAQSTRGMGSWLMALAILAVFSSLLFWRWLRANVLVRLAILDRGASMLLQGQERRLDDRENDELGRVARALNALQDRRQADLQRETGLLTRYRQIMLALVETLPPGSSIHGLDGSCLASRTFGRNPEREAGVTAWLEDHGRKLLEPYRAGQPTPLGRFDLPRGDHMRVELLFSGDGRPVAWLATVAGAPATLPDTAPEPSSIASR
jgi:hypothetical protein